MPLTKKDYEDSVVIELYEHLEKLFGQGSQVFSMEYPPRNLNARDYAYTIEDNTGVLFKPQTVAEAEFNLSDNMLDLAPIVQGSTGERISNLFKSVLNNYIPRLHYAARLAEEKGRLKKWLLEPIEGQVLDYNEKDKEFVSVDFKGTRMEYSARLYRTYLYKRQDFNELVNQRKSIAQQGLVPGSDETVSAQQAGLNFSDWLSTVAATKEEILSTFYNDAVVRGNLHEVNSAISFLDIPSLGQRINEIKRDLRSNVKRSVIGGGDIYSVNFSPSNWFESLTKSPSPIDVISNSTYRELQIEAKSNELNNARQQLSSLQTLHMSKDQQATLEAEIRALTIEIDSAYVEIRRQYQERLVTAVRFAQEALTKTARFAAAAATGGMTAALLAEVKKTAAKKARVQSEDEKGKIAEITEQTKSTLTTFVKLDRARQQSIELQSKLALAKSSDYEAQIKMLQHQINKLTEDLEALESEDALLPSSIEQIRRDITFSSHKLDPNSTDANEKKLLDELKELETDEERLYSGVDPEGIKKEIEAVKKDLKSFGKVKPLVGEAKKAFEDNTIDALMSISDINSLELPNDISESAENNVLSKANAEKKLTDIKTKFQEKIDETPKDSDKQAAQLETKINSRIVSLAKRLGLDNPNDEEEDYYQTIIITIDESKAHSLTDNYSSASSSGRSYDYWFSSGSSSSSNSSASTSSQSANENLKIVVKLRATKVSIERGGWFGVDILRMTEGMFHVDPNLKSATGEESEQFKNDGQVTSRGKFTHYPTSFIIVKDVEITKSSTKSFFRDKKDNSAHSSSSRRDSWFSSRHNESSQQSQYSETVNNKEIHYETISLPNPAILGWFQQIVPGDKSVEYGSNVTGASEHEFSETVTKFLKSVVFD